MTHQTAGLFTFDVRGTDTDHHDQLHLSALFSYMQEAAFCHFQTLSSGGDLRQHGLCWILVRLSVRLHAWPQWQDKVTVETWQRGVRRLTFVRRYRFFDARGEVIGEAASEWLIVDQKNHKPARPPREWLESVPATDDSGCERLQPVDQWPDKPVLVKYADFSDIDRNYHVNNTRYVAWAVDAIQAVRHSDITSLPPPVQISRFDIHYRRETSLGTRLELFCLPCGTNRQSYMIEARQHMDGVPIFRARALLADQS